MKLNIKVNKYLILFIIFLILASCWYYNKRQKQINKNKKLDIIPMYCIYIPKREKMVKKFFNDLEMEVDFVKGVDKNKLNIEELSKEGKIKKWKTVNNGRVACHFSHINVLKKFLKSDKERCLIFEDDIMTSYNKDDIHDIMKKTVKNIPKDCDILFFGYCWDVCKHIKPVNDYISTSYYPRCRHAYSVNRKAAEKIIQKTLPMYNNGDEMMAKLIGNGELKSYSASNILFEQNRANLGSELGNNDLHPACY